MNDREAYGFGVAAHLLGVEILTRLVSNGIFTGQEAREMVDNCLLTLEVHRAQANEDGVQIIDSARQLYGSVLSVLDKLDEADPGSGFVR